MKRIKICYLLLINVLFSWHSFAQEATKMLSAEEVLSVVKNFHPVVRQSNISIEKSRTDITYARAAFDPVFNTYIANKKFGGVAYYQDVSPEIRIPTWYGIDVYAGTDNWVGERVNPTVTKGESSYLGINVPLAKGLMIDKRRAALQQAKVMKQLVEVEQKNIINDLSMDAMEAYWLWVKAYQVYKVIQENVEVNQKRVELIRRSFALGERPSIDTTEALTQLQSFEIQQNAAWLDFQNTGLQLSAFLWTEAGTPYNLPESVIPSKAWDDIQVISNANLVLPNLLSVAETSHPSLQVYTYKLNSLQIDRKLKFQDLLPKIDFSYNQLSKGYNMFYSFGDQPLFKDNFQYGLKVEIPLRFSEGRANFAKAKLKIEETQLDLVQKRVAIQLKVKKYFNEFSNLKSQIGLQSRSVTNYEQLVKAEEVRFQNGESSLFLINSRESKALEATQKLIELKTKYYKSIYALQWSAGLLQ